MIDSKLKLEVKQRGTHILPVSEWNNDVPSPCECVAEALADLEFRIGELVRTGGSMESNCAYNYAKQALSGLNLALNAATKQNWVLTLEGHPEPTFLPTAPKETPLCQDN